MKPTISMCIGATHLSATLELHPPSWRQRASHLWPAGRARSGASPISQSHAGDSLQVTSASDEYVAFADIDANDEPVLAMVEAGESVLRSLRDYHPTGLDGCRLSVRTSMAHAFLSVVPLDASSGVLPAARQLQLIAEAVAAESARVPAQGQEVRHEVQPNSTHLCIVALSSPILVALQTLCTSHHLKLVSCQPALIESLDRELSASLRSRDQRTLVWTEHSKSGERESLISFVRIDAGSAIRAWRTLAPPTAPSADTDQPLQSFTDRFLLSSGAGPEDKLIRVSWPIVRKIAGVADSMETTS